MNDERLFHKYHRATTGLWGYDTSTSGRNYIHCRPNICNTRSKDIHYFINMVDKIDGQHTKFHHGPHSNSFLKPWR